MILHLSSRLFYVVLFCTMNGGGGCGNFIRYLMRFVRIWWIKRRSQTFLFHLSKEDLFPHILQIWTHTLKIILLKEIYRAIHAIQPRKMLKQLDIYLWSLFVSFVCYGVISQTSFAMLLVVLEKHVWWVGVHRVGFIKFLTNSEEII
jgi:hypothetical protein